MTHPKEVKERALRLYASGKSLRQVENLTGICYNTIKKWAAKEGVLRTQHGAAVLIANERSVTIRDAQAKIFERRLEKLAKLRGTPRGQQIADHIGVPDIDKDLP